MSEVLWLGSGWWLIVFLFLIVCVVIFFWIVMCVVEVFGEELEKKRSEFDDFVEWVE